MSSVFEDKDRLVFPRCLEYSTACSIGLLRRVQQEAHVLPLSATQSDAKQEWSENRTLASAIDFVSEALILREFENEEVISAAMFLLDVAPPQMVMVRHLATHFIEAPRARGTGLVTELVDKVVRYGQVARLKEEVRRRPANPIAWSDMALRYAALGQADKAARAMRIALGLAEGNRFILRAASRCFTHMHEPDRAAAVLRDSGLCNIDPWIASAEIVISHGFNMKSKCITQSRKMIGDDNLTHFSRSELAAAIATLELESGSIKASKRLMQEALHDPTENALAQVEWLSNRLRGESAVNSTRLDVPASYEAAALHLYYNGRYEESLESAKKWSGYLYLSSRPVVVASYLAATVLSDDKGAIAFLDSCTPAQMDDPGVLNNYALSLARSGDVALAMQVIEKAKSHRLSERLRLVITATEGLIAYRSGDHEKGRTLYSCAVGGFARTGRPRDAAAATYFQAVEEKRIQSAYAESKIAEAKRGIQRYGLTDLERLSRKL